MQGQIHMAVENGLGSGKTMRTACLSYVTPFWSAKARSCSKLEKSSSWMLQPAWGGEDG